MLVVQSKLASIPTASSHSRRPHLRIQKGHISLTKYAKFDSPSLDYLVNLIFKIICPLFLPWILHGASE